MQISRDWSGRNEVPVDGRQRRWHRRLVARARRTRTTTVEPLTGAAQSDDLPLTRSQVRELQRRIRDLDDRTRYLLVSAFTPRLALYYDVSQDTYVANNPSLGTLFKRRAAAEAIQRLLSPNVEVVRCRVNRHNGLVKSPIPRLKPLRSRRRLARTR